MKQIQEHFLLSLKSFVIHFNFFTFIFFQFRFNQNKVK